PGGRLRCRVRSYPTECDRPAGAGRTTADEHRQRLDPRRCRRRLQPDRATQGKDDHPRSCVRTVAALFRAAIGTIRTDYWTISSRAAINGYVRRSVSSPHRGSTTEQEIP